MRCERRSLERQVLARDDLVAELSFVAKVQVVSWYPGARHLAVAAINPGPRAGSLILR